MNIYAEHNPVPYKSKPKSGESTDIKETLYEMQTLIEEIRHDLKEFRKYYNDDGVQR